MNASALQNPSAFGLKQADPLETLLVGNCPSMAALKRMIRRVAGADVPVLVTGPTGAGKEVVAQALHKLSGRCGPLIAVNCAAIPRDLLESQLFGHEKGAFTGAQSRYVGLVEQAQGGTLFLDEIGEMPEDIQVKLLRVLETREVMRVGGTGTVPVSFRLVSATNRNLRSAAHKGDFRLDLFYRIRVFELSVPPLRDHISDIPALLSHMGRAFDSEVSLSLNRAAMDVLSNHPWPGNVRELRNFYDRAQVLFAGQEIGETEAKLALRDEEGHLTGISSSRPTTAAAIHQAVLCDYKSILEENGQIDLHEALARIESALVTTALARSGNCVSRAAKCLAVKRTTLIGRMKRLGIHLH